MNAGCVSGWPRCESRTARSIDGRRRGERRTSRSNGQRDGGQVGESDAFQGFASPTPGTTRCTRCADCRDNAAAAAASSRPGRPSSLRPVHRLKTKTRELVHLAKGRDDYALEFRVLEPKSRRSRRQVELSAAAVDALRRHRAKAPSIGFVFSRPDGRPLSVTTTWKRWRRLLERAEVPAMPFHSAPLSGDATTQPRCPPEDRLRNARPLDRRDHARCI